MTSHDSSSASIDKQSGFCASTRTFHSIRPPVTLPPPSIPLSLTSFLFSLLPSPLPSNPALLDASTGTSTSYLTFMTQVEILAINLRSKFALSKGDVIFVLSPGRTDLIVLYMSLFSIGAVVSPANPASTPAEISRLVNLSKPSLAFATRSTAHLLPPDLDAVLIDTPHFKNLLETTPSNVEIKKQNEVWQSDLAMIQYSSGTTGRIKAATLPHRFFIFMAAHLNLNHMSKLRRAQVALTTSPMFHSIGVSSFIKGIVLGQTTVRLTGERVTVADIIQAAKRYKVAEMRVAAPVVVAMAMSPDIKAAGFEALLEVVCGGAPLSVESARLFRKKFPHVQLSLVYGSTEGGGIAAMIHPEECDHLRSVGRLTNNVRVKIVDPETGTAMSVGQAGELWIQSPSCMTGYIGDDEANAAAFDADEGWLKTGDLCYIDQDGFVYIVGRLKELIKYKGYQVPPAELEDMLHSHPDVVDAAVFPIPDDVAGQIPAALVVRRDGSALSETQVIDYVAKQVAPYKKIRKVFFVDQIPKSPAGKILRRELSDFILQGSLSKL